MKSSHTTLLIRVLSFGILCFLAACAGKTANPIDVYRPDDAQMSCKEIKEELIANQNEMIRLYPKTKKLGKNVALGVAGAFFVVPLLFMDFSDAERVEIQAFQRRDVHLHSLGARKKCRNLPAKMRLKFS